MRYIFISVLILIGINSFAQKKAKFQSRTVQKEVTVDGIANEWTFPLQFSGDKITYGISNNDEHIYLLVQSLDATIHQKIMRSGITLTLSTKGKNKKKLIVNFPMRSAAVNSQQRPIQAMAVPAKDPNTRNPGPVMNRNQRFIDNSKEMKVKGFESVNGTIAIDSEADLKAAISWEGEKLLSYELVLPLKEILGDIDTDKSGELQIDLKLQVNAIPQPTPGGGAGGGGGRSSGGGGRGGGGGGGRSSGGGGMSPGGARAGGSQAEMFTSSIFKAVFTLANSE